MSEAETIAATITPGTTGEVRRGQDILASIRALKACEADGRRPTRDERDALARFGGFGAVALRIFPDPVTGQFHSPRWAALGAELMELLTEEEYASAKRTVFTAFYTAPIVMKAMYRGLNMLGVPADAKVLEPGCGVGGFIAHAPASMRFVGIELDSISARIARVRFPSHDIINADFREVPLKYDSFDAAIGNPPFADLPTAYGGVRLSLHDYFLVRSLDALKPGGVLAMVTSHFTMDRMDAAPRQLLADIADFKGAIRLPSDAFKAEGTQVVADVLFFRKRAVGAIANHASASWLSCGRLDLDGASIPVNQYFLDNPEKVLGEWSREDRLYGGDQSYSVKGGGPARLMGRIDPLLPSRNAYPGPRIDDLLSEESEAAAIPDEVVPLPAPELLPEPVPAFSPEGIPEGRFVIGEDGVIRQVIRGWLQPVVHAGTTLRADGTMTGRRLASLIGLRDLARAVLAAQNEGRSAVDRESSRSNLVAAHGDFVARYGPVNKTTISGSAEGSVIRRMPNVVRFREDPDAMIVLALEQYDEETGVADPAAIMLRDVVGPRPEVARVDSAEAGLLVSLDRRGRVDVEFIAGLWGRSQVDVTDSLGGLIFRDPASIEWETADAYLSGNVRAKLIAADAAGPEFTRNAEALRAVQPIDILPGDIDANLGAPWIPVEDIRDFAADLFDVPTREFSVAYTARDAFWSVEPTWRAQNSVAAISAYGTKRVDGITLLGQALNMKSPAVYDSIWDGPREVKVLNTGETTAAKEKQRLIKEKFRSWVFADHERAARLVRIYNDTYNNLRPRLFDGSHLEFPGMSQAVTLRSHQVDAVWRGMSGGNTLLAHFVGSGKTYTMSATAMKLKQAGIIRKPLFAVPNHLLEQFAREFCHLYPDAKLLIATKDDLARDRRMILTAKIAGGEWDGIIITHSSFERIGMSKSYRRRFLSGLIREYETVLVDAQRDGRGDAGRNIIKQIEKQKARYEDKLKDLMADEKKDDGLVFDELGIDYLFIDEAQNFKNLATPTKMDRVAGIQTGGSERAFDLFMKCRYLSEKHPGHGVTFATGTPISNTMVEMYTLQRFLDPEGLRSRGIEHFDAWAATFGEVVETMEISPDGASLRPRARFARFVNLPELVQLFRTFADVQTADMLQLPYPDLVGGKPKAEARAMSDGQRAAQHGLVKRYERIRSSRVDPREDNALSITTDGRKLALDGRLLDVAGDHPDSKLNAMVDNVVRIWENSAATRGTQLIFCDLGVHPRPFSVYEDVVAKLADRGIPAAQVAVIGDADTDAKKRSLFGRVNAGQVRVLIGSTAKMGTGMNVQKRLIALHHLDAPWKPAEVEQREGRILRQGNENAEVSIYRYVTEGSFDAFMWQALETKARFIGQVMSGRTAVRRADDIGSQDLSYAEVKAIASGNPAVMTLARVDAELQRLAILRRNHADEQFVARRERAELPGRIERLEARIAGFEADLATLATRPSGNLIVDGRHCAAGEEAKALGWWMGGLPDAVDQTQRFPIGTYRGLAAVLVMHAATRFSPGGVDICLEGRAAQRVMLAREHPGHRAVLNAIGRAAEGYGIDLGITRTNLTIARDQLTSYLARGESAFLHAAHAGTLEEMRGLLQSGLSGDKGIDLVEVSARAEAAMAGSAEAVEAHPGRPQVAIAAEEPVTARIRRGLAGALRFAVDETDEVDEEKEEDRFVEAVESDSGEPPVDPEPTPRKVRVRSGRRKAEVSPADEVDWDEPFRLRA